MKHMMEPSASLRPVARWMARRAHVRPVSRRSTRPAPVGRRAARRRGGLRNVGTTAGLLLLSVGLFALGAVVVGVLYAALVAGLAVLPLPAGTEIVVLIGSWAFGLALLLSLPFFVTAMVSKVIEVGEGWARTRAARRSGPPVEPESAEESQPVDLLAEELELVERPR